VNVKNEMVHDAAAPPQGTESGIADQLEMEENAPTPDVKSSIQAESWKRTAALANKLEGMYCPCAGFAFNSLAGDRNILVSPTSLCLQAKLSTA
jgi:hypothetical protein